GDVVAELRRRKGRDEKPFALMVRDLDAAKRIAHVSDAEAELLQSSRRPIVLLLRRKAASGIAGEVAPGNPNLGVMLPYTPLHHLLMREFDAPLVLSSGNPSDEPIAFADADARSRLTGIADAFLTHDRPIHLRCDDSVTRVVAGEESPIRRSRGYAPQPVTLPVECEQPTLALGGQLKSTFAIGRGRHAILSHHLGDLDHYEAYRAYTEAVRHYERLFGVRPAVIAHDLHPDYASTRYALERAREDDSVRLVGVQHHHAHLASCLADHGLAGPAIGVIFDGTGFGTDGTVWGGEFLFGDCRGFRRAAHLRPVAMPGGEVAIREPWRMALAYLLDAREDAAWLTGRLDSPTVRAAECQVAKRLNAPLTSGAGRLFDAVASLAGVRDRVGYEGQAAIELEGLATGVSPDGAYPFEVEGGQVDTRPLIAAVAADARRGTSKHRIARRFHSTLVEIVVSVCRSIRSETACDAVALSGGVFLNAVLSEEASARLAAEGFRVYRQRQVPPNDGGLCLGQLAVAAASGG
ncbi:MAG TPA: carbamoyltransferase HypF, partial [Gemmataceae bacterium]|nr:carbamoyltransferase HypF [Gemmataceae bacterium]